MASCVGKFLAVLASRSSTDMEQPMQHDSRKPGAGTTDASHGSPTALASDPNSPGTPALNRPVPLLDVSAKIAGDAADRTSPTLQDATDRYRLAQPVLDL
ncbi:MAG: hypothetical protein H6832_13265 [Planctomycetes bacterium]|nr:hypothetical protein [Planctomycetota bacterium]MCB9919366.1 hypothetical protein [Planctomycetota bacterium]